MQVTTATRDISFDFYCIKHVHARPLHSDTTSFVKHKLHTYQTLLNGTAENNLCGVENKGNSFYGNCQ